MTDRSPIDFGSARAKRKNVRSDKTLADFALTQCEQAFIWHDWPRFGYWFEVYKRLKRSTLPESGVVAECQLLHIQNAHLGSGHLGSLDRRARAKEVAMHYGKIAVALSAIILATAPVPVPAQTTSYSSLPNATVVASTTLPSVDGPPLYMRVIGGRIIESRINSVSTASGIYYQLTGAAELSIDGTTRTLHAGEGVFIHSAAKLAIRPASDEPPAYLEFLLSPVAYYDLPDMGEANGRELFRSSAPIPSLRGGRYILNLKKVTLPFEAPPDLPHHRSGAALHVVLSGFGAETANGMTVAKGPGSLSYEPAETVYQWSNPGSAPLTYLVFNLNPDAEEAVVADGAGNQ